MHIMMISHVTYMCSNPLSNNGVLNTHAHDHAGDVDTPVMCVVRHSLIGVMIDTNECILASVNITWYMGQVPLQCEWPE